MYLNKQDVLDTWNSKGPELKALRDSLGNTFGRYGNNTTPLTEKEIDVWIESRKEDQENHYLGKSTRPWFILDLTGKLDKSQPWVGVEYETGYGNKTDYLKVQNWLWKNIDNMTMDGEGCGSYPCEITFPPQNYNTFQSKDYFMDKLLSKLTESKISADRGGGSDYYDDDDYGDDDPIGIHVNMSTPKYRALPQNKRTAVAHSLSDLLRNLPTNDKERLFNRQPYGYCEARYGYKEGDAWIEGKLFDTTDSPAVWAKYKVTIGRLIGLIDPMIESLEQVPNKSAAKWNESKFVWKVEKLGSFLAGDIDEAQFVLKG